MRYLLLFLAVVLQIDNAAGYTVSVPQKICMQKELTLNFCAKNPCNLLPYAYCLNNPVRYVDPTGKWVAGTDGKPVTFTNGRWSSNASTGVQKIGNAMMRTPDGKKIFDDMRATQYGISLNYKEGFHSENRNKLGEAIINYDKKNGNVIDVTINLFDGKIQEDVAGYKKASQQGYTLQNPTEKQQLLLDQVPTMTERIGQIGSHEGTHATDPNAMPFKVGTEKAEGAANAVEMKVIKQTPEFTRPIPTVFLPLEIIK